MIHELNLSTKIVSIANLIQWNDESIVHILLVEDRSYYLIIPSIVNRLPVEDRCY